MNMGNRLLVYMHWLGLNNNRLLTTLGKLQVILKGIDILYLKLVKKN